MVAPPLTASIFPSGLNARLMEVLSGAGSVRPTCFQVVVSQRNVKPGTDMASVFPSGLNAIAPIEELLIAGLSVATLAWVAAFHTRICDLTAAASRLPSGLN